MSDIECPNCSNEAYHDFYYKTGEEYINCQHCGYHYSATIINRNKKLNELTKKDWEIKELKKPYGSYRIKLKESIGYECGSLINKKQYVSLKQEVAKNSNVELFTVSRLISNKIIIESIIDEQPR